jgi:MFS superfamily sulfate permease-like transporter
LLPWQYYFWVPPYPSFITGTAALPFPWFAFAGSCYTALSDFKRGTLMVVLPQLPLTLTNAVLVTSLISRDLYPAKHEKLSEKNLCLTMGGANLLIAPLGGYMMCHGSGGVVAHHRYGARTPKAIYMMGSSCCCSVCCWGMTH